MFEFQNKVTNNDKVYRLLFLGENDDERRNNKQSLC